MPIIYQRQIPLRALAERRERPATADRSRLRESIVSRKGNREGEGGGGPGGGPRAAGTAFLIVCVT
jgi:hypothetical protein